MQMIFSGKVSRSMMPAPPPPPPVTVCPGSPTDVLPDHKPGSKRLKRTDISAPILTSPDIMSRSYSAAEEKVCCVITVTLSFMKQTEKGEYNAR